MEHRASSIGTIGLQPCRLDKVGRGEAMVCSVNGGRALAPPQPQRIDAERPRRGQASLDEQRQRSDGPGEVEGPWLRGILRI